MSFAFNFDRWFPISTDSFDDLVSFEIDREEVDVAKLKETSWMVPTLAQWAAVLREDEAYQQLAVVASETLKHTCFQIWYPDEKTDEIMYHRTSHFETGIAEAPVSIPSSSDEMRANMKNLRSDSPIKEPFKSSATQAGFGWLDFIACRHYGTPLDPAVWQSLADIPPGHETKDSPPSGQNKISL